MATNKKRPFQREIKISRKATAAEYITPVPEQTPVVQIMEIMVKHTHEEQNDILGKVTAVMITDRRAALDAAYTEAKRAESASIQFQNILSNPSNPVPVSKSGY